MFFTFWMKNRGNIFFNCVYKYILNKGAAIKEGGGEFTVTIPSALQFNPVNLKNPNKIKLNFLQIVAPPLFKTS